jgi:protein tyrosine phosphatase
MNFPENFYYSRIKLDKDNLVSLYNNSFAIGRKSDSLKSISDRANRIIHDQNYHYLNPGHLKENLKSLNQKIISHNQKVENSSWLSFLTFITCGLLNWKINEIQFNLIKDSEPKEIPAAPSAVPPPPVVTTPVAPTPTVVSPTASPSTEANDVWEDFAFESPTNGARFSIVAAECKLRLKYSRDFGGQPKRYKDVSPYAHNRVEVDGRPLNISPVKLGDDQMFIGEAPIPANFQHFFKFLLQQDISTIVTLAMPEEGGRVKCDVFWKQNHRYRMDDDTYFIVHQEEVILHESQSDQKIVKRVFKVHQKGNIIKEIEQFHYLNWPDFGVSDPELLKKLIQETEKRPGPHFIHCSAGLGRSGVYALARQGLKDPSNFHLEKSFVLARMQRPDLVQTADQYMAIDKLIGKK